jgi:SAM-dependent methyltransferase
MNDEWHWDPSLFEGSAPFYRRGRLPYPAALGPALAELAGLDGTGVLADVGCGPGILAVELAPLFEQVLAVDPDPHMLEEARSNARDRQVGNVEWVQARIEELILPPRSLRMATFGRSFHWTDQPLVAAAMRRTLVARGWFVLVSDVKGDDPEIRSDLPPPPFDEIESLLRSHLGDQRRAGQGVLGNGPPHTEEQVLAEAGFKGPVQLRVPRASMAIRRIDDLVAFVFSRSSSAPHLFGDRLSRFETELRTLLQDRSSAGRFAQPIPDADVRAWINPS